MGDNLTDPPSPEPFGSEGTQLEDGYAKIVAIVDPDEGSMSDLEGSPVTDVGHVSKNNETVKKKALPSGEHKTKARPKASVREGGEQTRRAQRADVTVKIMEKCLLWHSPDGDGFVTAPVGSHFENWPINSTCFSRWLAREFYLTTNQVSSRSALDDVARLFDARAVNEGPEIIPGLRVAGCPGAIEIDLADVDRRVVEITARGWRLTTSPQTRFIRSQSMRPLPAPEGGEAIELLRGFVNFATDADFTLFVAWLIGAFHPTGPYPILVFNGEQGSGKSISSRLARSLIDPNASPIRAAPRDERDLLVAAVNGRVIALDNLSRVDPILSDALCRLSTGGGFSTRQLHTNREEIVFEATRPIILNGIPMLAERPDLADRAIVIRLRGISEEERRSEQEFWEDWTKAWPFVFGAICDGVSRALGRLPSIRLTRSPRLADFARWVTAAEPGLGWDDGRILEAYTDNRRGALDASFEADVVAVAVYDFVVGEPASCWTGTATQLLDALNSKASDSLKRSRSWPSSAQGLGNRIDRVAPLLRGRGLYVQRKHSGGRFLSIGVERQ